uniref:Ferritin Dps family protein n=1 Tax=Methanococcus maripaludis (strain C6 / ATCC BAA-1332) TaxID=444158 RepID=A9AAF2_METM6
MDSKLRYEIEEQINKEFYSAYLYLAMSNYAESEGFKGISNWFIVQAQEEMDHAMKFYKYLHDMGETLQLNAIDKPEPKWNSITDVFENGLTHEKYVTGRIHKLMDIAHEVKDYAAISMLQWFVNEQIEEESSFRDILDGLKLTGGDINYMMMLDKELGQRARTPPQSEQTKEKTA